jgi:hypothetical protein
MSTHTDNPQNKRHDQAPVQPGHTPPETCPHCGAREAWRGNPIVGAMYKCGTTDTGAVVLQHQGCRDHCRLRALRKALDSIANWKLDVRPGHCDYMSRATVRNMAAAALEECI